MSFKLLISSTLTNLCCFFVTEVRRLCVNKEGWSPRSIVQTSFFFTIKKQTVVGLFWKAMRWKKNAKSYILYIFGITICKWSWKFCSRNSSLLECGRVGTPFVDVVIYWINNNKRFNAYMSVAVLYIPVSTVRPHPQCTHGIFPRASDDISLSHPHSLRGMRSGISSLIRTRVDSSHVYLACLATWDEQY